MVSKQKIPKQHSPAWHSGKTAGTTPCCAADTIGGPSAEKTPRPSIIATGIIIGILIVFLIMRMSIPSPTETTVNLSSQSPNETTTNPTTGQAKPLEPQLSSPAKKEGIRGDDASRAEMQSLEPLNHTFTFEEVFERLRTIDKDRGSDFRKESLRTNILPLGSINQILPKVKAIQSEINRSIITNETVYWLHLVEGRIEQLESEKNFQLAVAYGKRGLFSIKDVNGSCARQNEILDAALLFNQTARHGGRAMSHFDMTLTQEKTWPILGINEKRMAFYGGETRDIGGLAYNTVEAVRTKCLGLKHEDDSPSIMGDEDD